MNRRGFLAAAIAATLAPKALVEPVTNTFTPTLTGSTGELNEAALEEICRKIAASMLETREVIAASLWTGLPIKIWVEKEAGELYARPIEWREFYEETVPDEELLVGLGCTAESEVSGGGDC